MDGWRVAVDRIRGLFAKKKDEKELDTELRAHLELLTEEHIRRGMSPEEAAVAAFLRLRLLELAEKNRAA